MPTCARELNLFLFQSGSRTLLLIGARPDAVHGFSGGVCEK